MKKKNDTYNDVELQKRNALNKHSVSYEETPLGRQS